MLNFTRKTDIEIHVTNICQNHKKLLTGVQDQNLLFTFLTNDYEAKFRQIAFSKLVRISHGQHLPTKFFQYLLLRYARDLIMSRLTCNATLRLV